MAYMNNKCVIDAVDKGFIIVNAILGVVVDINRFVVIGVMEVVISGKEIHNTTVVVDITEKNVLVATMLDKLKKLVVVGVPENVTLLRIRN